jgi:hypothetical protein
MTARDVAGRAAGQGRRRLATFRRGGAVGGLRLLFGVPFLALAMTGCGSDALAAADVATKAEDALQKQVGVRPDITCPDDLPAEVGAQIRCTFTTRGDPTEHGVRITVTSVDARTVRFDVAVDDRPEG